MTDSTILALNYIAKTPGFRDGEPHFAGRHLAIEIAVDAYINGGLSVEEIARAYDLTPAQVHAALAYYYDHRAEIEAIWESQRKAEAAHKTSPEDQAFRDRMLAKMKATNPEGYQRYLDGKDNRGDG